MHFFNSFGICKDIVPLQDILHRYHYILTGAAVLLNKKREAIRIHCNYE